MLTLNFDAYFHTSNYIYFLYGSSDHVMSQKIMNLRSDRTAFSPGQDEIGHVYDKKIDLVTFCDDFKP